MPPWCLNSTVLWQINHYAVWMTYVLVCQAELLNRVLLRQTKQHTKRAICIINVCKIHTHVSKLNIQTLQQHIITVYTHAHIKHMPSIYPAIQPSIIFFGWPTKKNLFAQTHPPTSLQGSWGVPSPAGIYIIPPADPDSAPGSTAIWQLFE